MRRLATLAALLATITTAAPTHADSGTGAIALHRIDGEPLIAFATRFFYKRHPNPVNWSFSKRYRSAENWSEIVRDQVYAAEADINDDGTPELILLVDNPNWCDTEGCLGAIFRRVPKSYELICETALPPPATRPAVILAEIENGYHHIATETRTVLWNEKQDYDSGQLCATESRGK